MEVREIADFTIRPRLLAIPGVAQVIPIGGEVRQYRVAPLPSALRALGVSYEQIEKALTQFGTNTGGGFTDQNAREFLIRNIGRTTSLEDLRNIVVTTIEGRPILLRQVANVEFAPKVKRGDAGYMGKPAVIVSVEKQPNVDTVRLTRQIEQVLAELERQPAVRRKGQSRSYSGRRISSKPRSRTSSGCCSKQPLSWPSSCSRSC